MSPTSRYYSVPQKQLVLPDGTIVAYVGRRFIPLPGSYATLSLHVVAQGERPDQTAAEFLGDPEQFWRLCDSNGCLQAEELTATPGETIRITLPEGIPGPPNA